METENAILASLGTETNKIKHYTQIVNTNIHHFYFYGEIEDNMDRYSDFINIVKTSSENDVIYIYVNSEGGSMRMALQIVNSMRASNARIITCLDGEAMSAATMIFLAGEEYVVNPNCTFMIHTYSGGMRGKGNELLSQLEHVHANVKKVLRNFYSKILTDDELEQVSNGRDIWMDSDELIERLDKGNGNVNSDELELNFPVDNTVSDPVESKKKTAKKNYTKKKTTKKD